ncbi:MAG: EamA family transporter, partial [Cyanobacteria bacterium P01_E01_bin.43]
AFIFVMPIGFADAVSALVHPLLILAGIGVGISSSVIPYICDQLAMSQLPRNTYALLLALLPATATIVGAIVLSQIPTLRDVIGILLVIVGVALHKPATSP